MKQRMIPEPKNTNEAVTYMLQGLQFFLVKYPIPTIIILLIAFGSGGYVLHDYINSKTVKVETAQPLKALNGSGSLLNIIMPEAYAQEKAKPNQIIVEGKVYGYYNQNYIVYVMEGKSAIFVYNKTAKSAVVITAPWLSDKSTFSK